MNKTALSLILAALPTLSWAYTECDRPITGIWNSTNGSGSVWIKFGDGGSAIYKSEEQLTEGQMSRFVSFALTAQTTGKKLTVRYPDESLTCPPSGDARDDVMGIWIRED